MLRKCLFLLDYLPGGSDDCRTIFAATRRGMPVVVFGAVRPNHGSQGWARNLLWQFHLERARAYCLTINALHAALFAGPPAELVDPVWRRSDFS
jgi:hypothetical protein